MCLAVPGQIIELDGTFAKVEFGGVRRRIALAFVPEARLGDYVLVHAGFAIEILGAAEAQEQLALLRELSAYDGEPGPETGGA